MITVIGDRNYCHCNVVSRQFSVTSFNLTFVSPSFSPHRQFFAIIVQVVCVNNWGYAVAQLGEALRYKPKGRGFDSRCSNWSFSVT
jgi:hypothetical protein